MFVKRVVCNPKVKRPPETGDHRRSEKGFERTKDPRFVTGGKPCARLSLSDISPLCHHAHTQRCRASKKCDHMTAQEPCSAVAMTLAGGEAEAEAVVQEDPAVLRLRRAIPLPPGMGIA
jgi:hypothetical protein